MSPHSLDPRARRAYRRRAAPYLIPAYLLLLAGLGALLGSPETTTVSQVVTIGWVEALWQFGYTVAAVALIVGLMRPWPLVELLGDWLALWALGVNLACLLVVRGILGAGLASFSYTLTMVVIALRIYDLLHRQRGGDRRRKTDHLVERAEQRLDSRPGNA